LIKKLKILSIITLIDYYTEKAKKKRVKMEHKKENKIN
jgi:hypothetical protein